MKKHRLFFALWPSEQVRQSLIDSSSPVTRKLHGRHLQPNKLHITLQFVGQATDEEMACMQAAARSVSGESFTLDLDHFGHFARAKILWMGPVAIPDELARLHEKLGDALSSCGYECDRRPYHPHVTLMRKCVRPDLKKQAVSVPWAVTDFVLVESVPVESGVDYQVIERYPIS